MWTIGKRRKTEGGFVGADIILPQWEAKSHTRRRNERPRNTLPHPALWQARTATHCHIRPFGMPIGFIAVAAFAGVGFVASNPVPREGMDVYSGEQKVGTVSSGECLIVHAANMDCSPT